jgi:hypothetical protein
VARDAFPLAWFRERCSVLRQRGSAALQRAWGAAAPTGRQGLETIKETSRKTFDHLRAIPWQALARRHWKLLLVIGAVIIVGIIWKVPQWQAAEWQGQMEPKDLAKLQNDARTTLVQALGGAVLLIGLYFTLKNLQLTQDRQITERYTRAVEQLGSDKLELRLGAIYALERIARDSEPDHWPIMEILTAYVRERAPWKEPEQRSKEEISPSEMQQMQDHQSRPKLATDIQAVLTVIGRRTRTHEKGEDQRLDLSHTNLRGASLTDAQLQGAILDDAQLQGAGLYRAQLQGASLYHAQLQGAGFYRAQLQGASLYRAQLQEASFLGAQLQRANLRDVQLQEADLFDAQLQGANLWNAQLQGADLMFAQLAGARNLTIEQLSTVYTLYGAVLDPPLREQIEQQFSHHRYRCRFCHLVLDTWVPTAKAVDEGLVMDHLAQGCDSDHTYLYVKRAQTEGIATVAAQAFEIVKERQA